MMPSVSPPHIGFIVDHPKRDLGGAALFARAIVRQGGTASLIPLYEQGIDVPLLGLNGLVTTFARPANRGLVESYARMGIPVWVLDTEGGVLADDGPNTPHRLASYVRESGFAELLAGYLFWGPELRDAFVRDGAMDADRLVVTGCPRFDFTARRYQDLLTCDWQGFVLVNMNFSSVNSRFGVGGVDRDAMVSAGWDAAYTDRLIAENREIMAGMIETVQRLAADFPDRAFVVRPHPFESSLPYEKALGALINVEVRGEGSVLNVIRNSACVLHLNCGTAVEAVMLGRLPVSLDFLSTPMMRRHSSLPSRVSLEVHDYEELRDVLADPTEATSRFNLQGRYDRLVAPYFHRNDGLAAERAATALLSHASSRAHRSVRAALRGSHAAPGLAQRARASTGAVVGSRAVNLLRSRVDLRRQQKRFEPEDVHAILAPVAAHLNEAPLAVEWQRHPLTGARMASVRVAASGDRK